MKSKITMIAFITAVLCLTGCGDSEDSSSEKSGTVSVSTNSQSQTTLEDSSDDSSEVQTTTTETSAETTTSTETTTTEETTTKETTTTTAETTTTTTATTTTTSQSSQQKADLNTFQGKVRVVYNGYEFGVGDKISEVQQHLGEQPAPSSQVPSCLGNEIVDEYYYYGMMIQANNDIIFSIDLMDNGFYGNISPTLTTGLACSMTKSDMENSYGSNTSEDDMNYYYSENNANTLSMQVTILDGKIARIWVNDSGLG